MRYFLLSFIFISSISFATNYYVSPLGCNTSTSQTSGCQNDGKSITTAFQTLNFAASKTVPGDTVFVMNGTYTNTSPASNVLNIYISGTASKKIVYKNYPGHSPLIKLMGNNWSGIAIQGADYITIDGFQVVGNNDAISLTYALSEQFNTNNPATSGNGIGITSEYNNTSNKPHHNVVRNCIISKCGGGGIYTYWADYTTIENNTIFECAWYAPFANSGISLYQNWNSDSEDVFKNFIIGNTCYRNENYIPFFYNVPKMITDGNGIIIDDGRNTQNNSTQGVYSGKTYVANNLIYDNGGRGIHVYESDKVIIVNNTCYQNCQSPAVSDGEYTAYRADRISFVNNIAFPSAGIRPINRSSTTTTNLTVEYNLWGANSNLANPIGTNTITGNPNFVLPSTNSSIADFRLQATSDAINAGTNLNAPSTDKAGKTRTSPTDIGCYEYQPPLKIIWENPNDIDYGTVLDGTQLNATSNIAGTFVYNPAKGEILKAGANQNLWVTFIPTDAVNYAIATKQVTINVRKAIPSISWSNPADIVYGTTLSSTQLNATSAVDGSFIYTPASGTKLNAGSNQKLSVTFTPTDGANYASATKQVTINVSIKAIPSISWSNPADVIYGTALSATQLNATSSVDGTFSYTPVSGTKLNAGSNQNLSVIFTPVDAANYTSATKQVTINVNKATPSISWSNSTDIVYGTALSATQLNAMSLVDGTFSYTPLSGTKLNAGSNQNLSVTFTPADAANYTSATKLVNINVSKAPPSISWNNPADIFYGTLLSSIQLNASSSVDGTFSYTPISGTKLNAGSNQNLSVTFTPADAANYTSATKQVTINVSKATPSLTWSNPADIVYGTTLSATQLNATSSVTGTFIYSPAVNTKLNAGNAQQLSVTFSPTDDTNYLTTIAKVSINVSKAQQQITFGALPDKTIGDGSFTLTATVNSTLPVSYSTISDKIGIASGVVSLLKQGRVDITANQSGNENYNAAASVSQNFCIKPIKPIITLSGLNTAMPTLTSSATTGNQWYLGTTLLTGETNNTFVIKTSGTYKVLVKADDCLSEFSLDQNLIITGDIPTTSDPLLVYPNPATSILIIDLGNEGGKKEVAIFDLLGRNIFSQHTEGKKTEIDVSEYTRGLYIIKVQTTLGKSILRFEKQ